jgi:hypothetical protein
MTLMTKFSFILICYLLLYLVNYSDSSALSARNKQTTVVTNFIIFIILRGLLILNLKKSADWYLLCISYFRSEFQRPFRHRWRPMYLEGFQLVWLQLNRMWRSRHFLKQTQRIKASQREFFSLDSFDSSL